MITEHEFSYCPKCGGNLQKKDSFLLVCRNCDLHYYINPKACNAIILTNEEDEILLVKRKYNPHKGKWDLPGGFIDPNETIEESVKREVREELDIDISKFQYFSSFYEMYEHGGINAYTICAVFTGTLPQHVNITPSDDAEEIAFFKREEIPLNDIAFGGMKQILSEYTKEE